MAVPLLRTFCWQILWYEREQRCQLNTRKILVSPKDSFIPTLFSEFPLMNSQSTFSFLGKKQFIMTGKLRHQILLLPDGFKLSST